MEHLRDTQVIETTVEILRLSGEGYVEEIDAVEDFLHDSADPEAPLAANEFDFVDFAMDMAGIGTDDKLGVLDALAEQERRAAETAAADADSREDR